MRRKITVKEEVEQQPFEFNFIDAENYDAKFPEFGMSC